MNNLLIVESVSFNYPDGTVALNDVNLAVGSNEKISIVGSNGSGKTTLSKNFNGLLLPTKGEVRINNISTKDLTVAEAANDVGYVFQNPGHQIFSQTVEEEVAFGLKHKKFDKSDLEERLDKTLEMVGIADLRKEHPLFLTLAEKQLVAIASCIILEPSIIVLDEPTSSLDLPETNRITNALRKLHSDGKTIIIITHDMQLVAEETKRVIAMDSGEIVFDGKPRELFSNLEILNKAHVLPPQITELGKLLVPESSEITVTIRELLELLRKHPIKLN